MTTGYFDGALDTTIATRAAAEKASKACDMDAAELVTAAYRVRRDLVGRLIGRGMPEDAAEREMVIYVDALKRASNAFREAAAEAHALMLVVDSYHETLAPYLARSGGV